jgi:hypothetical protein
MVFTMDFDELIDDLRRTFPVFVSILSASLSIASLLVTLQVLSALWIVAVSIASSLIMSVTLYLYARSKSFSRRFQDIIVLRSVDTCEILDAKGFSAIYIRKLSLRASKLASFYGTFPAKVSGQECDFEAYQVDSSGKRITTYDVKPFRTAERQAFFVYFRHPLERGKVLDDLCVKWRAENTFVDQQDSIVVTSEPGQKSLVIQVIFPSGTLLREPEWIISYGNQPSPIDHGTLVIQQGNNGRHTLTHDFSEFLPSAIGLRCAVSWKRMS